MCPYVHVCLQVCVCIYMCTCMCGGVHTAYMCTYTYNILCWWLCMKYLTMSYLKYTFLCSLPRSLYITCINVLLFTRSNSFQFNIIINNNRCRLGLHVMFYSVASQSHVCLLLSLVLRGTILYFTAFCAALSSLVSWPDFVGEIHVQSLVWRLLLINEFRLSNKITEHLRVYVCT